VSDDNSGRPFQIEGLFRSFDPKFRPLQFRVDEVEVLHPTVTDSDCALSDSDEADVSEAEGGPSVASTFQEATAETETSSWSVW